MSCLMLLKLNKNELNCFYAADYSGKCLHSDLCCAAFTVC